MLNTEDKGVDSCRKLSNATKNLLLRNGVTTVSQMADMSVVQLANMKIGPKRAQEILSTIKEELTL